MLHNVVLKATFERTASDGEAEAAVPFHIADDSNFVEPDDIAESLEKNGHKITLTRTLNMGEFFAIFRDISKYLPNRPTNPFVVGNPCSLLAASSRVASQSLKSSFVAKQPRELAEQMACNLPPEELGDYIRKEKTIEDLRKEFTVDGLQLFLLHFFKTYSRCDLPEYIKSDLKLAKKMIKSTVYSMAMSQRKNEKNWRFYHIDWVFPALGCFQQLSQFAFRNDSEYIFYLLKFRHQQQYGRYPVPTVPFCLSRLVPERDYMIGDLTVLDDDSERNTRRYLPKETKHEEFLMLMRAIAEGAWRECHHEILAFSAHVLCNEDMLFHPYWKKYYFYVWGELAVSLAELNLPHTFPFSCLKKMRQYAEQCISFEIDGLLYEQKVYFACGQYELEELCFNKILKLVPKQSAFYLNSCKVHILCFKKQIEDLLAKDFAYRKDGHSTFNTFFGMDVRKNALTKFEDNIETLLDKYKKLMHKMCATFSNEKKQVIFEQQLVLVTLWEELLMNIKYDYGSENKWQLLEASLVTTNCNERHFVSFYKGPLVQAQYLHKMYELKKKVENHTKVINHLSWANICFSHFLMLKVIGLDRPEVEDFLYNEALTIYSCHDHPRALTIKAHLVNHTQENSVVLKDSPKIEPNCTIQWLLRNGPKVKQFVRLGISSVERFDLWLTAFDWEANLIN
jgi:hypothetical protein